MVACCGEPGAVDAFPAPWQFGDLMRRGAGAGADDAGCVARGPAARIERGVGRGGRATTYMTRLVSGLPLTPEKGKVYFLRFA